MNADNEVTSHRSEILNRSEISNSFEFISGLMETCSNFVVCFCSLIFRSNLLIFVEIFVSVLHSPRIISIYLVCIFDIKNYLW